MRCSSRRFLALICATGAVACSTPATSPTGTGGAAGDAADAAGSEDSADTGTADTGEADTGASDVPIADVPKTGDDAADVAATDADVAAADADATAIGDAVGDTVGDTVNTDAIQAEVSTTDGSVDAGPPLKPSATVVKVPYSQAFGCAAAAPEGWVFDAPLTGGLGWAIDATPKTPGFQSADCSLNYNNGTDFQCPATSKKLSALAIGPMLDATALPASAQLKVRMAIAGKWESGSYDSLDLEASTDDTAWVVVKSYDAPSSGWSTVTEDLAKYAGKKFRLRLRFWTEDCTSNSGAGAFVDDWKVFDATCKAHADCDDANACTDDTCDTVTGKCSSKNNTATCDDGDACTTKDACAAGKCTGAAKCDDTNGCTDDTCAATTGECTNKVKADGAFCSDGNACTTGDLCTAGKCTTKGTLPDGDGCSDSDPCTTADACKTGVCTGGKSACDDGDPCTTDACTKQGSFTKECTTKPAADGATCTDGLACTTGDACKAGICAGSNTCTTSAFADAFDCAEAKGWVLDVAVDKIGWAIDATPAVPAPKTGACTLNFNNGKDYDNGDQVKGNATSPIIDLATAGVASLGFWSYSGVIDTTSSYDKRLVEILVDGKVVQTQQLLGTADIDKWVAVTVDLTAQAGKKIQVRFRFDSGDEIDNDAPGWFIDDVAVAFAAK